MLHMDYTVSKKKKSTAAYLHSSPFQILELKCTCIYNLTV